MHAIPRYVVFEVLKTFVVALTLLTTVMIAFVLFREAREQGLEPRQILKIVPFVLPEAMRYTIPATILFAVTSVYGRMSGSNEFVAIKSLGIHPMRVIWPVFALAFAISLATVWLNDAAVSWGRTNMRRVIIESVEEIVYGMLRAHRSFSSPFFSIIVKRVEGRTLIEPTISFQSGKNNAGVTLTAETAELRSDTRQNLLSIVCRRGTLDVEGQARLRFDDTIERAVPLDAASQETGEVQPSQLPLDVMSSMELQRKAKIAKIEHCTAAKAMFALATGDFAALTSTEAQLDAEDLKWAQIYLYRLQTEPHRRWAGAFSCLCFVLIGVPVAIWLRNSDLLTNFFLCFLPILLVYYPLLLVGVDQAKSGKLPPISVWLGNAVLAVLSGWIMRRVLRH
ncbi:MAG TPA: LptF/LptG family permease [Pirellulales bacterium]|nr:LptF/LptG family permease [Pirellulales bacterium]